MIALHITGWLAVATGVAATFYGMTEGGPAFVAAGLSAVVAGILYLALARGLDLLTDIRDRLPPATTPAPTDQHAAPSEPAGSLQDLEQRLAAMRDRPPAR